MQPEVRLDWPQRKQPVPRKAHGLVPFEVGCGNSHDQSVVSKVVFGDALDVANALLHDGMRGKVDLVYVDPPFASQSDYLLETRLDGAADGRVEKRLAYEDRWGKDRGGLPAYLEMLHESLSAMYALLREDGTLWVHLDWRANYLVRVLLDEICGRGAFLNEIIWKRAPNLGRQAASAQFGRTLDTILVYGKPKATLRPPTRLEPIEKGAVRIDDQGRAFTTAPRGDYTDASIAKLDAEGRIHRTATGKVYVKYFLTELPDGSHARARRVDALWTDIAPLRHVGAQEKTGYPTQKPRALLERIIAASTDPGAWVVDLFSGSGTTGETAYLMGRSSILGDASPVAIATSRARLLRAGASPEIVSCGAQFPETTDLDVKLKKKADGSYDVQLNKPIEPLAWCIDVEGGSSVFQRTWHSERLPGKKTVACKTLANVSAKPVSVRVYSDSGSIASIALSGRGTVKGRGQLPLSFEEQALKVEEEP
jgi:DNA modification methylase